MAKTTRTRSGKGSSAIRVIGARENNLKDVSTNLPLGKLTAISGASGSGKSSLVHQVIGRVAERRFGRLCGNTADLYPAYQPDVDSIENLPACVIVKQEPLRGSRRSTVASYTKLIDTLATLYAKFGKTVSPGGREATLADRDRFCDWLYRHHSGRDVLISNSGSETMLASKKQLPNSSYCFVRNGSSEWIRIKTSELAKQIPTTLFVASELFRTKVESPEQIATLLDKVGHPWLCQVSNELVFDSEWHLLSDDSSKPYQPVTRRLFSFNSDLRGTGQCAECEGIGELHGIMPEKVFASPNKPILDGGTCLPFSEGKFKNLGVLDSILRGLFFINDVSLDASWNSLSDNMRDSVWNGSGKENIPELPFGATKPRLAKRSFKGLRQILLDKAGSTSSGANKFSVFIGTSACESCCGSRYNQSVFALKYRDVSFPELVNSLSVSEVLSKVCEWKLKSMKSEKDVLEQVEALLDAFVRLNLGHLQLGRSTDGLSGGEAQRLRLAQGLSLSISDCCYILDEPSRALHPRDTVSLAQTIRSLAENNNTILMVEHNQDLIAAADYSVEMGPGGGSGGGHVVYSGEPRHWESNNIRKASTNATSMANAKFIRVVGLSSNNVHEANFSIPLGATTVVVGVSGAGKSSAILKGLAPNVESLLKGEPTRAIQKLTLPKSVTFQEIVGQTLSASNRRSIVATTLGVFDVLRKQYATSDGAVELGLDASAFTFNGSGACRGCGGIGVAVDGFGAELNQRCQLCDGNRFNEWVDLCEIDGFTLPKILDLPMSDLLELGHSVLNESILRTLDVAASIGLGHLSLGRVVPTLSAGERQRVSLVRFARQLNKKSEAGLLILDEPTAGLSRSDAISVFTELRERFCRDAGHTLIAIEHKLELLPSVDWIIEFGPGGGPHGGKVVFEGTYSQLLKKKTATSEAIRNPTRATSESPARRAKHIANTETSVETARAFETFMYRQEVTANVGSQACLQPTLRLNSRSAPGDVSVAEVLDILPRLLEDADLREPTGVRYFETSGELRSSVDGTDFGFSPVGMQRRLGLVAASDLLKVSAQLRQIGFFNAIVNGDHIPLSQLKKSILEGRHVSELWVICSAVEPDNLRRLALTWGQGVVKVMSGPNAGQIHSTQYLPDDRTDYRIGTKIASWSCADRRSADGRCAYCMGSGLLPTYPIAEIVANQQMTMDQDGFWNKPVLAGVRSLRRQKMIPEAKFFATEVLIDFLKPIGAMDKETQFLFEYGIPWRRFLKPSAKRQDREQDYYSWRGLHEYVYMSLGSIKDKSCVDRLKEGYKEIDCAKCHGSGVTWESEQLVLNAVSIRHLLSTGTVSEASKLMENLHIGCAKAIEAGLRTLALGTRIASLRQIESEKLFLAAAAHGPLENMGLISS